MKKILATAVFISVFLSPLPAFPEHENDGGAQPTMTAIVQSGEQFFIPVLYCPVEGMALTVIYEDADKDGLRELVTIKVNLACVKENNDLARDIELRTKQF